MMRECESRWAEPDHQHLVAGYRLGHGPAQIERVPARQQSVNLEAPRQMENILERARLDLRNIDRLLLLIDAGLHAVVADAVAGAGNHRSVNNGYRQGADRISPRLDHVHLGYFFFQGAAGESHPERAFLEDAAFLVLEAV